jgi:hypothetical protein
VGNTPIIADGTTNSWRVSKFWQYLQTLYRTTILEFNRFLTDFGYELSNYKSEQLLPSSIIGRWWFFRATVDQLHMSNNASHIFFSVVRTHEIAIQWKFTLKFKSGSLRPKWRNTKISFWKTNVNPSSYGLYIFIQPDQRFTRNSVNEYVDFYKHFWCFGRF